MKKLLSKLGILAVIVSILPFSAFAESTNNNNVRDLLARKDNKVGTVETWNDYENIYVKYKLSEEVIEEGWCITETHFHLAGAMEELPNAGGKNKNLVPGQFEYKEDHELLECVKEYEYTISLDDWEPGNLIVMAAHAKIELWDEECNMEPTDYTEPMTLEVVSDESTLWDNAGTWENSVPAWVHGSWATDVSISGATWIWNAYKVTPEEATNGAPYQFKRIFDLPYDAENIVGEIEITADNEYEIFVNGTSSGSNSDWRTVTTHPITLQQGENTLIVDAINYAYATTNPEVNPGGLIYRLYATYDQPTYVEVCTPYMVESDSAWAEGENFNEKGNWATYFNYEVSPMTLKLVSKNSDWTINEDGPSGILSYWYGLDYTFTAEDLKFNTPYTLINYGGWSAIKCLGSDTSHSNGDLEIKGLMPELTQLLEETTGEGAKIWVVPTSNVDCTNEKMLLWNPLNYLFEFETLK